MSELKFVAINEKEIEEFKNSLYEFSTRIIEHQRFLETTEKPTTGIDSMFSPWRNVNELKVDIDRLLHKVKYTEFQKEIEEEV